MSSSNECYKIIMQCFAKLLLIITNPDVHYFSTYKVKNNA